MSKLMRDNNLKDAKYTFLQNKKAEIKTREHLIIRVIL